MQPALLSGATLILAPSASVPELLDLIGSERPTSMPLVPPALAVRMLEEPRSRQTDLSSIEQFLVGGQALPTGVSERLRDELGIAVRQMFGMAEGMFLLTPGDATEDVRHHTVGAPISPADEVRITEVGSDDPAPVGEIGEFCARGPYTIRGYYRAEQHNQSAFSPDGFYQSATSPGPRRRRSSCTRSRAGSDVINRGGEDPRRRGREVILRHPGRRQRRAGRDARSVLGERGCAYLIIEPGAANRRSPRSGVPHWAMGSRSTSFPSGSRSSPSSPCPAWEGFKKHLREQIAAALRDDSPTSGAR